MIDGGRGIAPARRCALPCLALLCLATCAGPIRAEPCALPADVGSAEIAPPPAAHWSRQERWVWACTLAGEVADFNKLYGLVQPLDPSRDDGRWFSDAQPRRLSADFLSDVMAVPEFAEAVPRRGLRVFGAWFDEIVDLTGVSFDREIWFNRSLFDGEFHLRYGRVGLLSVEGSSFARKVDFENARFDQHVLLSAEARFNDRVHLFGMKVGGNFLGDNSIFNGDLQLQSAEIGNHLLLRNGAEFRGWVDVSGAKVGGSLDVSDARFARPLYIRGTRIARNLTLAGSDFLSSVVLNHSSVGGALVLAESTSWPQEGELTMDGFVYESVDGDMMTWSIAQYEAWLAHEASASPQPYQHLAALFREAGAYEKANDILYAGRERVRSEATGLRWLWLWLLKVTIGYGIGTGYFRALIPVAILTLVGTLILKTASAKTEERSWGWCFWASFDEMLPLIELDDAHAKFINANLSTWRLNYFYIHRVIAFILGSFVVAGLAGLTQGT
jgi:hypothetical protein